MGTGADVMVIYFGNWKCPFCADFTTGFLGDLVTEYVEPGDIDIEYRTLAYVDGDPFLGPDAPRAARAGLGVWMADPQRYWPFHEYVMANQPPESEQWATTERLVSMAEAAGVSNIEDVRSTIEDDSYNTILRSSSKLADRMGVQGTPTLRIGETVVNALEKERVRSLLDDATA
jgi:protein-disulfide isomerase